LSWPLVVFILKANATGMIISFKVVFQKESALSRVGIEPESY